MRHLLCAAVLLASASTALAQQGVANSTNGYTAAQRAQAEAAAKAAGYTPTMVADAQGGAMFLWALKDGRRYYLTVTTDGKVHAGGVAIIENSPAPPGRGR
ncbi:MAG TPA: hypothetical protein VJ798_14055 [Rhizomicrobium sp.]|nr:hypothetical protein [Rhizomicrobium sp.]